MPGCSRPFNGTSAHEIAALGRSKRFSDREPTVFSTAGRVVDAVHAGCA